MILEKATRLEKKDILVFTPSLAGELFQNGLNGLAVRPVLFDHIADLLVREPWKLVVNILNVDRIIDINDASISLPFENFAF
jgi:hypothetical protein